jgi:hypothetical protein
LGVLRAPLIRDKRKFVRVIIAFSCAASRGYNWIGQLMNMCFSVTDEQLSGERWNSKYNSPMTKEAYFRLYLINFIRKSEVLHKQLENGFKWQENQDPVEEQEAHVKADTEVAKVG